MTSLAETPTYRDHYLLRHFECVDFRHEYHRPWFLEYIPHSEPPYQTQDLERLAGDLARMAFLL